MPSAAERVMLLSVSASRDVFAIAAGALTASMPLNVMEWSVSASRDAFALAAGPLIRSSPVSKIDASARMSTALLAEPATGVMPSSAERVSCLSARPSSSPRTAAMALSASMPETSRLSCCANAATSESSSARAPSKP